MKRLTVSELHSVLSSAIRRGQGDYEVSIDLNKYGYTSEVYISANEPTIVEASEELMFEADW